MPEFYQYRGADFFHSGIPLRITIGMAKKGVAYVPHHTHDFVELVLIIKGEMIHQITLGNGRTLDYALFPGDIFSILPGESHSYRNSHGIYYYNLLFLREYLRRDEPLLRDLKLFSTLFGEESHRSKVHLLPQELRSARQLILKMIAELSRERPGRELYLRALFNEFLIDICRQGNIRPTDAEENCDHGILKAISVLEESPAKKHTVSSLARIACMSESLFYSRFFAVTGMSPIDYLINLRLKQSIEMLLGSSASVAEIALTCGFCDSNHFIRTFRKKNGLTPLQYRRQFIRREGGAPR